MASATAKAAGENDKKTVAICRKQIGKQSY